MSIFIDRKNELAVQNKRYLRTGVELIILYNRKRIVKSELIGFLTTQGIRFPAREKLKH